MTMRCPFCWSDLKEEKRGYVCEVCGKKWKKVAGKLIEVKKWPTEFIVLSIILLTIILANVVIAAIEYTSDPRICTACHGMEKYFESWNESTHRGIKCYECHFGKGPVNFLRGTYHSLSALQPEVPPYVDIPANISNENCLACHHDVIEIEKIEYKNMSFSHRNHLEGYKRGFIRLQCVSCHSELVIGSHIAVKDSTCFVCHFYKTPEGVPISGCPSCHGSPQVDVRLDGYVFNHSMHVDRGIKCELCHDKTYMEVGNMTRNCQECHRMAVENVTMPDLQMHEIHVDSLKLDCLRCHPQIIHRPIVNEDKCKICHTDLPALSLSKS